MDIFREWKRDVFGWYFEMDIGGTKDWGIDWDRFISHNAGDVLATAVWTVPTGITKISEQVNGNQAKVKLATPTVGIYACSHLLTTVQGIVEPFAFRVVVK